MKEKSGGKGVGLEPNLKADMGAAARYVEGCHGGKAGERRAQPPEKSPEDGGARTNGIKPTGTGI